MKKMLGVGDKVMFSNEVVARIGHDKTVADMRGVITEVDGRVALVDTRGTYPGEGGNPVRGIPLANLVEAI
jgi:hypothetical protein